MKNTRSMKNTKSTKGITMTNRRRSANSYDSVKKFLVVGSFAATLIGTQLLGQQETAVTNTTTNNEAVTIVVPSGQDQQTFAMPPGFDGTNKGSVVQLEPIPQARTVTIAPVARTRSSQ